MNPTLLTLLQGLELGKAKTHRNMTLVPLTGKGGAAPDYITLAEALDAGTVTITEVSEGGSVPDLKVVNRGEVAVLMLDGEELAGAKQNRVLNTTILLGAGMETVIPVSCTEQGRWAYESAEFSSSGNIMATEIRKRKSRSVSQSLRCSDSYASDQGEVWDSISELHAKAGTSSHTGAMKEAFEKRQEDLAGYEKAFEAGERQTGMLVLIGGKPAGLDLVSRAGAYGKVHPLLVRSYALDALTSGDGGEEAAKPDAVEKAAKGFVAALETCGEEPFPSVGLGRDFRYEGEGAVGSALTADDAVVHAAFFADEGGQAKPGRRMSSMSRRRRSRRRPHEENQGGAPPEEEDESDEDDLDLGIDI